ncbi:MAG: Ig-like domain-containing protein, partial [Halanaerobiales bacterium]
SATITVMNLNNTVSDACIVHVSMPVEVESISINKEELTLIEGSEEKLSVSIHPSDADNKEVIWESDNTEVATVDKDGNITGIKPGEALISVKSVDGEKAVSCHVIIEKKSILNNLNYKMTNRRNKHAGKELLLTPNYIYYNQDGKLYKSDYDGNNKVMLTDILMSKSEIQIIDEYIYFFGKKEGKNYFYKIKSDGSQQAELISRNKQIGSLLGCAYYKGLNCVIKYGIADMFVYRDKLYFQYAVKYRYRYSDYCDAWYIASYDPAKDKFDGELRKGLDITRNSTTWHYYDEIWLGSGFLFYSDTYDTGFFKKPINKESTLLSNVAPSNILSDETHVYYIDLDYNSLNRMTLEGTLSQKLMDNVSYFTMTDFNEIIFVSGGKVYIVDKEFETQPRLIAEGIDKFIYAGDYLYYYQPDLSIKRIVIETGEEQLVTAGIQQ